MLLRPLLRPSGYFNNEMLGLGHNAKSIKDAAPPSKRTTQLSKGLSIPQSNQHDDFLKVIGNLSDVGMPPAAARPPPRLYSAAPAPPRLYSTAPAPPQTTVCQAQRRPPHASGQRGRWPQGQGHWAAHAAPAPAGPQRPSGGVGPQSLAVAGSACGAFGRWMECACGLLLTRPQCELRVRLSPENGEWHCSDMAPVETARPACAVGDSGHRTVIFGACSVKPPPPPPLVIRPFVPKIEGVCLSAYGGVLLAVGVVPVVDGIL